MLIFYYDYFTAHCLSQEKSSIIYSYSFTKIIKNISFDKNLQNNSFGQQNIFYDIAEISTYAFILIAEKKDYQVTTLLVKNFEK